MQTTLKTHTTTMCSLRVCVCVCVCVCEAQSVSCNIPRLPECPRLVKYVQKYGGFRKEAHVARLQHIPHGGAATWLPVLFFSLVTLNKFFDVFFKGNIYPHVQVSVFDATWRSAGRLLPTPTRYFNGIPVHHAST